MLDQQRSGSTENKLKFSRNVSVRKVENGWRKGEEGCSDDYNHVCGIWSRENGYTRVEKPNG